jgi:hypothetical protein
MINILSFGATFIIIMRMEFITITILIIIEKESFKIIRLIHKTRNYLFLFWEIDLQIVFKHFNFHL